MIRLLCVGKMKEKALQSLAAEYVKRISPFVKVEIVEVKDDPNTHAERDAEVTRVKDAEAERVLAKLRPSDHVVLLDLRGRMWRSRFRDRWFDGTRRSASLTRGYTLETL